jgi:hypothetical protein
MRSSVVSVACLAGLSTAASASLNYSPALGTMPTAQGWQYHGPAAEIGTVSGGTFSYGPTATANVHYWDYAYASTMDFSTQDWAIETRVRLTDTFFGNNSGFRRGGFVLFLQDDFGRSITADIGSAALGLRNDNTGLSDPSMAFDLSSAFHTIRLEADAAGGRLLIDGATQMTLAFGSVPATRAASWGESSTLAYTGLTEIGYVNIIPAPASLVLLGAAGLSLRRRR